MWPKLVDYSKEECKQMLRKLELEAYSSVVSALRAQGELNQTKKKILQDLSHILSITLERHQAEIRRAVNDERLSTIAFYIDGGSDPSEEWAAEGRRLIPLMPRLIPQTPLTSTANMSANSQSVKNEIIPPPCSTGFKQIITSREQQLQSSREISPKRARIDNGSNSCDSSSPKSKSSTPTPSNSAPSLNFITKGSNVASTTNRNSIQLPSSYTVSTSNPRVLIVPSNGGGPTFATLTTSSVNDVNSSSASFSTTGSSNGGAVTTNSCLTKARIVQSTNLEPSLINTTKQIIKTSKTVVTSQGTIGSSGHTVTVAPGTRFIPTKAPFPQQVVVIPSGGQQKTITIPLSQSIKGLQVPSVSGTSNTAVVYQTSTAKSGSIKTMPGTITIQTFKPSQRGGKIQAPNLIIMPAPKSMSNTSKPITLSSLTTTAVATGAPAGQTVKATRSLNSIISLDQFKNKIIIGESNSKDKVDYQ